MTAQEEIVWLEAWLKREEKRRWVPWIQPIIRYHKRRLRELKSSLSQPPAQEKESR